MRFWIDLDFFIAFDIVIQTNNAADILMLFAANISLYFYTSLGLPYSVEKPNKRKKQIRAIADNWAYIPIEKE